MTDAVEADWEIAQCQQNLQPRYRIQKEIGRGTYGIVFRASDETTQEMVAVKWSFWPPEQTEDHGLPMSCVREAALLNTLQHPNIVQLKQKILSKQGLFLVFELCHCNLWEYLRMQKNLLDSETLISLSRQMFEAVAFCHERNIMHRDLKPDNILLDSTHQHVKVADFGLARCMGANIRRAAYTDGPCSVAYRPPEVLLGQAHYGTSVDVWSLGCILCEMATLNITFKAETEVEMIMQIFRQFGTPTEETWPGVTKLPYFQIQFAQWQRRPIEDLCAYPFDLNVALLVEDMLELCPEHRISLHSALVAHPFFLNLIEPVDIGALQQDIDNAAESAQDGAAGGVEHTEVLVDDLNISGSDGGAEGRTNQGCGNQANADDTDDKKEDKSSVPAGGEECSKSGITRKTGCVHNALGCAACKENIADGLASVAGVKRVRKEMGDLGVKGDSKQPRHDLACHEAMHYSQLN